MLGDINAADRTFQKAAKLMSGVQDPKQQRQAQAAIHQHQGLLLFARNDFPGEQSAFISNNAPLSYQLYH